MLVVWRLSSVFNSFIIASCFCVAILSTPLQGEDVKLLNTSSLQPPKINFDWVRSYFNSIDSTTDPEEIVDFLISLKLTLRGLGYSTSSLQELCEKLSDTLKKTENQASQETLSAIYEIVLDKESSLSPLLTLAPRQILPKIVLAKNKKKKFYVNLPLECKIHDLAIEANIPIRQYLNLFIEEINSGKAGHDKSARGLLKYSMKWRDYLDNPDEYTPVISVTCDGLEDPKMIALCEILAGVLLLGMPQPTIQALGTALITHGVNTLTKDQKSDTNRGENN
jgi:hypothetical protein